MKFRGYTWALVALLGAAATIVLLQGGGPTTTTITIVTQPIGQVVPLGGSATLSVAATVSPVSPLAYQWRHAGTNLPNPISRVAGGTLGDGFSAASTTVGNPSAVAVDASGNVFIADALNSVVRKMDTQGTLTTVAGSYPGSAGYSGDHGPATLAALNQPGGVAVDAFGNLFIADTLNHAIRKVSSHGTITTVAGNGSPGYSGDGGPAINAGLNGPAGIAVDANGSLYIADRENHAIRKVSIAGTITTIAGQGPSAGGFSGDGGPATNAQLRSPAGVAVDSNGNLFIADFGNSVVRKIDPTGAINTIAGICFELSNVPGYTGDGGAATNATLYFPFAVAVDAHGTLLIADPTIHVVRQVDTNGVITTFAGNGAQGYSGDGGAATSAALNGPAGLAVSPQGQVFIAEPYNNAIRQVNTNGIITTVAGNGLAADAGDSRSAINATLAGASGVALDAAGNLFIADTYNHSIRKVDTLGIITTIAGNGLAGYAGDTGPATAANLNTPNAVVVDATGNLFIADTLNHAIRKIDVSGTITTVAGIGTAGYTGDGGPAVSATLNSPYGIAADSSGNLFIADTLNHAIRKVDIAGTITTMVGTGVAGYSGDGGPAASGGLNNPCGVAVDANGNLFIADTLNHSIRQVDSRGTIFTLVGNGVAGYSGDGGRASNATLQNPLGVAVDSKRNYFIADFGNNVIRKVNATGAISTVAGTGLAGSSGDGGPAQCASLFGPSAVVADAAGNVFIADANNAMVRKVTAFGPTLTLPSVGLDNTGSYDVIVSTPGATVSASSATVTSGSATVAIVGGASLPVAGTDAVNRPDNTQVVKVLLATLLANDQDPANRPLTITAVGNAQPQGATVVISGDFAIYTASSDSAGDGSFTYTVSDGTLSSTGRVTITQTSATADSSGPTAVSITAIGSDFAIKFLGVPGQSYGLQYTTNPSSPFTWHEFAPPVTVIVPSNGVFGFTDVAPPDPLRLYRAVLRP